MPDDRRHFHDDLPLFLTVAEAATLLRKGRSATYAAIERGQIPSVRVGRTLRVPRDGLLALGTEAAASDRMAS
jgi:excisionase family DNA binding protein